MHDIKSKPIPQFPPAAISRFWASVDIRTQDECWLWKKGLNKYGYGQFGLDGTWRAMRTNRVAYFLHYGIDPLAQSVLHKCDVRACCNPHHYFLGSRKNNSDDREAKGRTSKGEALPQSVLTENAVREIRRDAALGTSYGVLMKLHGVCRASICHIVKRNTWKHVTD